MSNYLSKILFTLEKKDKYKIFIIFALILICTIAELMSIGLIIPILHLFAGDQVKFDLIPVPEITNNNSNNILFLTLGFFLILYVIKFYLNRTLIKVQNSFSHNLYAQISKKLFKLYLNKNFSFFVQNNSSDLIRNIQSECNIFSMGVVFYLLQLISEIIIFSFICIFLIYYNFQISIIVIALFASIGTYLFKKNASNLRKWGDKRHFHSSQALKQLQQSFGSFRELIMNNLIEIFHKNYSFHIDESARVGVNKDTVTQMPRLILEILAVSVLILIICFLILKGNSLSEILVLLGVFFYSTIRLLPSISKIVRSVQNIKFNHIVVDLIFDGLTDYNKTFNNFDKTIENNEKIKDFKNITVEDIDFSYNKDKEIFNKLNLEIIKGEKIGIIGETGSGKSSLINILCGLIDIKKGKIYFNEPENNKKYKSIQSIIGYVPQSVSIFDESVKFNVCLADDINSEDFQNLQKVLDLVEMKSLVDSLPHRHDEVVGENGSKLSGGQNQRLGIARAIFKNPKILILDEATSALDINTEQKIIKKILEYFPNLTLIIISHRASSLKFCNKIYEVKNFKLNLKDG